MGCLQSLNNRYGGTYVSPESLPQTSAQFSAELTESIKYWSKHGIKVVWLKLPSNRAELYSIAYRAGFVNHHCDTDWLMMTLRLQKNALVPPFANHTIGVGGLVINEKNELLTIREKDHVNRYPDNWKFPGGMLDPLEHFEQGVMREVEEETNIKTQFESFVGFRHHHQGQFSTSNIYAVCRLKPLTFDIKIQQSEIADARWFPIDEYLGDKKISAYNKSILVNALKHPGLKSIKLKDYMNSEDDYEIFASE